MIARTIPQAILGNGSFQSSDRFEPHWREAAERIVEAYGLPPGVNWPDCLFVVPFARRLIAIVSLFQRRFRFLILTQSLYDVIPDPFAIVERFPPRWESKDPPTDLEWPEEHLPKRTVAMLDATFREGDGPFLLGACQTLVDSGRIVLVREEPATKLVQDLWMLIPDSTRRATFFATYAPALILDLNLVVLPKLPEGGLPRGYLTDEQTRDYPESRYERELQTAVEAGDQRTVDRLFARRTSKETLRLALWIVLGMAALSIVTRIVMSR